MVLEGLDAVCHAAVSRVLATTSTGTRSMRNDCSQMMLLMEPRPISIIMPVMPLMLSTQPGKGSFQEATTEVVAFCYFLVLEEGVFLPIDGLTMATGSSSEYS